MKIVIALIAPVLLCATSCGPRMVMDPTIPHRISRPSTVYVLARQPDGTLRETSTTVEAGDWVISQMLMEAGN